VLFVTVIENMSCSPLLSGSDIVAIKE